HPAAIGAATQHSRRTVIVTQATEARLRIRKPDIGSPARKRTDRPRLRLKRCDALKAPAHVRSRSIGLEGRAPAVVLSDQKLAGRIPMQPLSLAPAQNRPASHQARAAEA